MGWSDPFPDEHSSLEPVFLEDKNELVYDESYYKEEYSPRIIYLPSKLVMIKMMRACIGVDKPQNLWIN